MDNTQGNIIIALLVLIAVLIAKKSEAWLRYDTGGNGATKQEGNGRDSDSQSDKRPSPRLEPKPAISA